MANIAGRAVLVHGTSRGTAPGYLLAGITGASHGQTASSEQELACGN